MIFRKKEKEEEVLSRRRIEKKAEDTHEWDKKKISIALIIFAVGLIGFLEAKSRFFPDSSVLGTTSVNRSVQKPDIKTPKIDLQKELGVSLDEVKNDISSLDAKEVASSSPQIQKVLKDIESIKDMPTNEARDACMKICSGI